MDKIKRNERVGAMSRILTDAPGRIFTLSYFCSLFDAAKSTVSEDVELLRTVFRVYHLGRLDTITGAAGGVMYVPQLTAEQSLELAEDLARELSAPDRVLTGGFLYMADVVSSPHWMGRAAQVLVDSYRETAPDFVLTVETSGIPIAMMTARALCIPVVVARRDHSAYEGSVVTINYRSGSGKIQTMSLSRRAVKPGQRALIVDDFMKAGGTVRGLYELMNEFEVSVVGTGLLMMTREPVRKSVEDARSILVLENIGEETGAVISKAEWVG